VRQPLANFSGFVREKTEIAASMSEPKNATQGSIFGRVAQPPVFERTKPRSPKGKNLQAEHLFAGTLDPSTRPASLALLRAKICLWQILAVRIG